MHRVFIDLQRGTARLSSHDAITVPGEPEAYWRSSDGTLRTFSSAERITASDILLTGWHEEESDAWREADEMLAEVAHSIAVLRGKCHAA